MSRPAADPPGQVELAPLMGEMQRHGAKLGFAIAGRYRPLADFYLEELLEVLDEIEQVEAHDGMPIAHPARTIMSPLVETLADQLGDGTWANAEDAYRQLIAGCNRCHQATEHGFIEILPAAGPPPYNQRFAPAAPAAETE